MLRMAAGAANKLLRRLAPDTPVVPVRQKYGNKPTRRDGVRFASEREADRWSALQLLQRAGEIRDLRRQVPFRCVVAGQLITTYIADFVYEERVKGHWLLVVDDSKGFRTPAFDIKWALAGVLFPDVKIWRLS